LAGQDDLNVVWDDGVHLEGTILWFDPRRAKQFCAITSARAPLSDRQTRFLWGDKTARLVSLRQGRRSRGLVTPYGRSFSMGNLNLELFASGYMTGASQFQVTGASGASLVYSGPISMQRTRTAENIVVRRCDTLVLDCMYGHERYAFPQRKDVYAEIVDWTGKALKSGHTPVFLAANPGKAQDLIHLLGAHRFKMRVHRGIYGFNKAYRGTGIDLPNCKQFRGHPAHGEVMIWPSHLRKSKAIRNLRKARFAAISGHAGERGAARKMRVSVVFPWSARANFAGLNKYVDMAKPSRVITCGACSVDFARTLGERGISATPLVEKPQLDLI